MSLYHVTFKMPAWIAQGIAQGIYEVCGGVVRHVGSKQVVMWLRPAAQGSVPAAGLIPLVGLSGGALLATAVTASVAVISVAGFAYLAHLHNNSEQQAKKIMIELKQNQKTIEQVLSNQIEPVRHKMESAIESLRDEEAREHFASFQLPITALRECSKFYQSQMEQILADENPLEQTSAFVELAILHRIACQAKARALAIYRDPEAAFAEAERDASIFAEFRAKFLRPFKAPENYLDWFVRLDEERESFMHEAVRNLPATESYYLPWIEGLGGDPKLLEALNEVARPRANEGVAGIIPASQAPLGWLPEQG